MFERPFIDKNATKATKEYKMGTEKLGPESGIETGPLDYWFSENLNEQRRTQVQKKRDLLFLQKIRNNPTHRRLMQKQKEA